MTKTGLSEHLKTNISVSFYFEHYIMLTVMDDQNINDRNEMNILAMLLGALVVSFFVMLLLQPDADEDNSGSKENLEKT